MEHPEHPWISTDHAPVYVWSFPRIPEDDQLEALFVARETWAEKVAWPTAWVVDLTHMLSTPVHQRRLMGQHLERISDYDREWNRGSALVVPNPVLRQAVNAVYWLSPPVYPHAFFGDHESALAWAVARLAVDPD